MPCECHVLSAEGGYLYIEGWPCHALPLLDGRHQLCVVVDRGIPSKEHAIRKICQRTILHHYAARKHPSVGCTCEVVGTQSVGRVGYYLSVHSWC